MTNWKNKFRKKKQKFKSNEGNEIKNTLTESNQDLIGDEWQKADKDFSFKTEDNGSVSPMFEEEGYRTQNFISLDELANQDEHIKARERLVKLEELREFDPLQSKNIKIDDNRIEAKFQEFRKPYYMVIFGIASFFIAGFLASLYYLIPYFWAAVSVITGICLITLALSGYMSNPTVTVLLDENKNAVMSSSGFFTDFKSRKISGYELFYYLHESRSGKKSFLHLDLQFEDKRYFSISGKTSGNSQRNDRAASGAEDLQALGGEYAIQQIAKLLDKAKNCKKV